MVTVRSISVDRRRTTHAGNGYKSRYSTCPPADHHVTHKLMTSRPECSLQGALRYVALCCRRYTSHLSRCFCFSPLSLVGFFVSTKAVTRKLFRGGGGSVFSRPSCVPFLPFLSVPFPLLSPSEGPSNPRKRFGGALLAPPAGGKHNDGRQHIFTARPHCSQCRALY